MSDKAVLFCDTVGTEKRILDLFGHETPKSSSIESVLQDGFTFDKLQYELRGVKLIFDNDTIIRLEIPLFFLRKQKMTRTQVFETSRQLFSKLQIREAEI